MRHAILVLVVLSSAASADPPKYTRKQQLHFNDLPVHAPKPRTTETPKRPITADEALSLEERRAPIWNEQEPLLLQLMRDTPDDDPDKPDYFFRLAELYARQHRLWRLKAIEAAP